MYVINAINVRDALPKAVRYLTQYGHKTQTRVGEALVSLRPITIRYSNPKQHVLVDRVRNANPFFHLMEAMWMLAGRDDGAFLDHYIKDFSKLYGNKEGRIMDAYGHRWRCGLEYDQLEEIVDQLRKTPNTRQAVLQMWGAGRNDLLEEDAKPCNLVISFHAQESRLNMTVFNRSNDLVKGCCGANAVHFAILQEYLASKIGIEMGEYWQVSTNLHLYTEDLDKVPSLFTHDEKYEATEPLMEYPNVFDEELGETMEYIDLLQAEEIDDCEGMYIGNISNRFLSETVVPMAVAHFLYKEKNFDDAFEEIEKVKADDWRRAGKEWLERRQK